MSDKRVLIVTQEIDPYVNLTNVAEIVSKLPKYMNDNGMQIRVLMPKFGNINERRHRLHEVVRLSGINIVVDEDDYPLVIKVASLPGARLQVYFLDNEEFFERKAVFTDEDNKFFNDNADRMIFFCKGVIETIRKFGWPPNIIHCHGWMTSLIPMYLKTAYKDDPIFAEAKTVFSVYENSFRGKLDKKFVQNAAIDNNTKAELKLFEGRDASSLYIGGSEYADALIYGSKSIDKKVSSFISKKNGKRVLDFVNGEDYLSEYKDFYQELMEA